MSLNATPLSERTRIGFFGIRNVGKSSVVNAVTGQELSVVSPVKGTTTDPVQKTMELLPLGPVVIIDTPGMDDSGSLGELRVQKTRNILRNTDIAVLVTDAGAGLISMENELISLFKDRNIPYIIAYNKCDLLQSVPKEQPADGIYVSAATGYNVDELKERIAAFKASEPSVRIVGDLIKPNDFVVLVIPIDSAAPKGRLILPQQQTIRDVLETGATAIVVKETELEDTLAGLAKKPSLVITDSQAFETVSAITPEDIPLTSFSILFARYKGSLETSIKGVNTLDKLNDGDTVLIAEGCTHHRQCDDIGTVKLPRWINNHTGKRLNFAFTAGGDFPEELSPYRLIIHCGGCMINEREMKYRHSRAIAQNIPITNYGIVIAHIHGILKRSLGVFI